MKKIDLNNLKNKKVVVMGLGLLGGGVEVVKWLIKKGADVLVTDLKKERELRTSLKEIRRFKNITFVLGKHREQDFVNADLIIKNPAVPKESKFLKIARKNKIPIESDLSLFFRLFKGKIIGITGTKGKSTTVSLLGYILKTAKKKFILGGNIGQSPIRYLDKKYPLAVLEISSAQLEDMKHLKMSPQIACIITIFPDHLDRYKDFQEYIEAKKLIFKFQKRNDILILNADNPIVKKFAKEAKAKIRYFSKKSKKQFLFGRFPVESVLAAKTIASVLKIPLATIKKALKSFPGLANRLEFVKKVKGVSYINDSASTVPQSTILALDSLTDKRNVILISGGADKNLDFQEMAKRIKEKCKAVVLLPGTATEKIRKELLSVGFELLIETKTMKEAVKKANKIAKKGDIILLSPGCASFGLFKNAYHRGEEFVNEVKKL